MADKLSLPKERVSIRDTSFIEKLEGLDESIMGLGYYNSIGIAKA